MASASATIAAPSNEAWAMANSDAEGWPPPLAVLVLTVVGKRNSAAAALCASQGQETGPPAATSRKRLFRASLMALHTVLQGRITPGGATLAEIAVCNDSAVAVLPNQPSDNSSGVSAVSAIGAGGERRT